MSRLRALRWIPFGALAVALIWGAAILAGMNPTRPADQLLSLGPVEHDASAEASVGDVVVLVHGFWRSSASMGRLQRALEDHGYTVWNHDYPSTRAGIDEHAEELVRWIEERAAREGRPGALFAVGHSMGGLVLRAAAARPDAPRFVRILCLGTPHQGSLMAERLSERWPQRWLLGQRSAWDLRPGSAFLQKLGPPPPGLATISGGRGDDEGFNPDLPGDDDGKVRVVEAELAGQVGSLRVATRHTALLWSAEVRARTLRFLASGRFE